jgi:hypothetical protein
MLSLLVFTHYHFYDLTVETRVLVETRALLTLEFFFLFEAMLLVMFSQPLALLGIALTINAL